MIDPRLADADGGPPERACQPIGRPMMTVIIHSHVPAHAAQAQSVTVAVEFGNRLFSALVIDQ